MFLYTVCRRRCTFSFYVEWTKHATLVTDLNWMESWALSGCMDIIPCFSTSTQISHYQRHGDQVCGSDGKLPGFQHPFRLEEHLLSVSPSSRRPRRDHSGAGLPDHWAHCLWVSCRSVFGSKQGDGDSVASTWRGDILPLTWVLLQFL